MDNSVKWAFISSSQGSSGTDRNHREQPEADLGTADEALTSENEESPDNAVTAGKEKLSDSYLKQLGLQYDRIIGIGKFQNPITKPTGSKRGRPKKGKVRALVDRLEELKASVCLFLTNFAVPFDNNQAERDLRNVKTKTKVSGCFRTEDGARDCLKIMSYVGTAHKRGKNAYTAICEALSGNPLYIFE